MGIVQSYEQKNIFHEQTKQIRQQQFYQISNYSYTHHIDPFYGSNYTLLAHKQRPHVQIEKYQLFFNSIQQYKAYYQNFQWRNKNKFLIHAKDIKKRTNRNICSTFHQATIYIERIPIRACQITDIPIEEGLYLLYCCFLGFRKIYQKTGYFQILPDMICINKQAQVKVWLNSNLSKNFPQFYSINQNFTEADFLFRLLQICEPLIDFGSVQQKFSSFLRHCYCSTQRSIKNERKQVDSNKFCKFNKMKNSSFISFDKNSPTSKSKTPNFISFDEVIQFFQGYLSKHNLVVARQMKSIKDLYRTQPKIQFKQGSLNSKKQVLNHKQQSFSNRTCNQNLKLKIDTLEIVQDSKIKKPSYIPRKTTKRTNQRLITDRSVFQKKNYFVPQQKNLRQSKSNFQMTLKSTSPQVSLGYKSIPTRNQMHNLYSPQHAMNTKNLFPESRQRIKTVMTMPNISFKLQPTSYEKPSFLVPFHRQKSISTNFDKNINNSVTNYSNLTKRNVDQTQKYQIKKENEKIITHQAPLFFKRENNKQKQNSTESKFLKRKNKNRAVYYSGQKQFQIDQQIAGDLENMD